MNKFFNVNIEFDKEMINEIINSTLTDKKKGYVVSVDANNFSLANRSKVYNELINNALFNICDSSVVSFLLSKIYNKRLVPYVGADFFIDIIKSQRYKSMFLGSTPEILSSLKNNLTLYDKRIQTMKFIDLPFIDINSFNYNDIARIINSDSPDFIWVSLGAPKQEYFMANLLSHINSGILFGVGAILNFYSGIPQYKRAPQFFRDKRMEWLYRIITDKRKRKIFWTILYNFIFYLLPKVPNEYKLSKYGGYK